MARIEQAGIQWGRIFCGTCGKWRDGEHLTIRMGNITGHIGTDKAKVCNKCLKDRGVEIREIPCCRKDRI